MTTNGWAVPAWLAEAAQRVPVEWGLALPNVDGVGFRWSDAADANGVRIDLGNPEHTYVSQRIHHVIVRVDGNVVGRDGGIVEVIRRDALRAHIPLEEWMTWSTWKTP